MAGIVSASLSSAQTFWPDVVDTVDVRAPRPDPASKLAARSGFSTIVPLGREVPAGRDLADLLDRVAGLQVHRYGGLGAFTQASVRGSSPAQVAICLDGVPLAFAGEGAIDLSLLPAASFSHAEVLRGPQVAGFGGPPAAGIINLVTPRALAAPLTLTAGVASFGTTVGRASWGLSRGPGSLFLSGQWRGSDGDYPYLNRNGTLIANTGDDRIERRRNNDFEDLSLVARGSLGLPIGPRSRPDVAADFLRSLRLDYTGRAFARDGGVPGTENLQTRRIRLQTERQRHQAVLSGAWLRGLGPVASLPRLEAGAHHEALRDRYDNPEGEAGLSRASTDDRTVDRGLRAGLSILTREAGGAWPAQEVRIALDHREERWTPYDRLRAMEGFTRTRRHRTLQLEDRVAIGRASFEAAYRWTRAADNHAGPVEWGRPATPSPARVQRHEGATLGLRLEAGRGLTLKANRGRVARFPSFPELFGVPGTQDGNAALRAESGRQWDAGFAYAPAFPLRLESGYFESVIDDRITLIQNSQRSFKAQNVDRCWVRGVESSLFGTTRGPAGVVAELQGSFTWQEARDIGPSATYRGKELPYLPSREGHVSLGLVRAGWGVRWDVAVRSSHFRDRYNSPAKKTPGSTLHDLALSRAWAGARLRARLSMENIADRRVEDQDGFPLPGRLYTAELSWSP